MDQNLCIAKSGTLIGNEFAIIHFAANKFVVIAKRQFCTRILTIRYKSILKEKPWLLALALYPLEGIENPELLTYSTRSPSFTMSI